MAWRSVKVRFLNPSGNKANIPTEKISGLKIEMSGGGLSESLTAKPATENSEVIPKPLSREFLLSRGSCCGLGCTNCPWGTK